MSLRDYLFYEEPGITLYCGDSLDILPLVPAWYQTVITDPVWPNFHPRLVGSDAPKKVFGQVMALLLPETERLCVWLGCQSDPRFLDAVPPHYPFLRMSYLRRAVPTYNGRCLVSGDVLYSFGTWPKSREGARVIPGETYDTSRRHLKVNHPAPRSEKHARWVVKWWGDGTIMDPFAGTGTTLLACKDQGTPAIGIEIEPKYCEIAVRRLRQEVLL